MANSAAFPRSETLDSDKNEIPVFPGDLDPIASAKIIYFQPFRRSREFRELPKADASPIIGYRNAENKRRPGRPRAPWYRYGSAAWREVGASRTIAPAQRRDLQAANDYAKFTGRELNALITLSPTGIDEIEPKDRQGYFDREIHRLRQWAGRHLDGFTALWVMESCNDEGDGQHGHLLAHIPDHDARWSFRLRDGRMVPMRIDALWRKTEEALTRWWGGRPQIDLRPIIDQGYLTSDCYWHSALNYVLKTVSPAAGYRQMIRRAEPCPVPGKRVGWSKDLHTGVDRYRKSYAAQKAARNA